MKIDRSKRFIEKAKEIHSDKYDYSKVEYVNAHTKVCIICPKHGEFWVVPNAHLNSVGCPGCSSNKKMNTEAFIKRAKEIYGDKYDYSKVEYKNARTPVCIVKLDGSEFWQTPDNHLRADRYDKPKNPIVRVTTEDFVDKAKEVHRGKYDYSKVEYINSKNKVCIICPEHGEFWIRPNNHLLGQGCPVCGELKRRESKKTSLDDWVDAANHIHNSKYDYSKVEYVNNRTKVCIVCPKHGEFWQTPSSHLSGKGCPICRESELEKEIIKLLNEEGINYEYRYHSEWLGKLELDFFLPDFSIAIECQGKQHYQSVKHFGGVERFIKQLERDKLKKKKCDEMGISLLYYSRVKKEGVITSINVLKREIYERNKKNN